MSTDPQDQANSSGPKDALEVSQHRLWFGFLASAIAWISAGCLDIVIVWACAHQEDFGIPPAHPIARLLFVLLAVVLLIVSVCAGIVSYRNWQRLSARQAFLDTRSVERREYMAVLGVIITLTLGMGIIWYGLPTFFLDLSWRAR